MVYEKELLVAQLAIQRASILSRLILKDYSKLYSAKTITKEDASPVTIADFAVQSVIISSITQFFPNDVFVAEESSDDLQQRPDLQSLILKYTKQTDSEFKNKYNNHKLDFKPLNNSETLLLGLGKGGFEGGRDKRFWILDPIDGTKGFLRNDQFALCLSLMVNNKIRIGVNGCPNLPVNIKSAIEQHNFSKGQNFNLNEYLKKDKETEAETIDKGLLFTAVENQGAFVQPLYKDIISPLKQSEQIHINNSLPSIKESIVLEGVEAKHSNHEAQSAIKSQLQIPLYRTINLDSQAKYSLLALGVANIYLRMPMSSTYREKIWDHSLGYLLVKEAGGTVSDIHGNDLDFTKGKYLESQGIVAGSQQFHEQFVKASEKAVKL